MTWDWNSTPLFLIAKKVRLQRLTLFVLHILQILQIGQSKAKVSKHVPQNWYLPSDLWYGAGYLPSDLWYGEGYCSIVINRLSGKKSKSVLDFLTYSRETGFSFSYKKVKNLHRAIGSSNKINKISKFDNSLSFGAKQNALNFNFNFN